MTNYPIDAVVLWVDGSDPEWLAVRNQYRPAASTDSSSARYREWGLFQYWFRSIEKYAPWLRTIHLVTFGHLPPWLNTAHPKLHIVNHKDYIPKEYLPTFNANPIELNIHRIPGLAEHFIYFNDDMYLTKPTTPEDFFVDGLPVDTAVLGMVHNADTVSFMPYINLNGLGCINEVFSKKATIKAHPGKWFNWKYGADMLHNLYFLPGSLVAGFKDYHRCMPFCRSTLEQVWEAFPKQLDSTCRNRFRSREDVNQYFFRFWRLMKNEFVPGRPKSAYLTIGSDSFETIQAALLSGKYQTVCVNDDPSSCDFDTEQKRMAALFESKYPEKSSFEKPM